MAVRRIVANIATDRLDAARAFYGDLLGMSVVMDLGWITTFAADGIMAPQISVATEGGSGTTVPDLSIEVDNLSDVHRRAQAAGLELEYGPVAERRLPPSTTGKATIMAAAARIERHKTNPNR